MVGRVANHKIRKRKSERGIAAIEYAILLPVVVLLTVGGIDLVLYMLKHNAGQRILNVASLAIQRDQTLTSAEILSQGNSSLLTFPNDGFICAVSIQVILTSWRSSYNFLMIPYF